MEGKLTPDRHFVSLTAAVKFRGLIVARATESGERSTKHRTGHGSSLNEQGEPVNVSKIDETNIGARRWWSIAGETGRIIVVLSSLLIDIHFIVRRDIVKDVLISGKQNGLKGTIDRR